jgi:hypothetical protein
MDKDTKDSEALDKEIYELQNKIADMKKGFESTIHDFSKGKQKYIKINPHNNE